MSNSAFLAMGAGVVGLGALGLIGLSAVGGAPKEAPAQIAASTALSGAEQDAFRSEVRAYLMDNPEVLMEAIGVLEARQAEQQAAGDVEMLRVNADDLYNDPNSWIGGNPDGDITIVEFLDYRCGYCRRAHGEVNELLTSDGNIRLIVKEFPILGEASLRSSQFAVAVKLAAGDEAYKAAHDALIDLRPDPSDAVLAQLAATLGLDGEAIIADMTGDAVQKVIAENLALGQRLSINGTPTFVMGDQMVRGYLPLEGMQQVVAEERG
ncbi:DsbA family protein [Nereida sp. MMG025]|uniref:DsbA family protein n=1 Tax=Nereida sp. MMG025 TaxID=2909981 RepID=UPI001F33FD4C|nr:DsbA family protein [Nereida sp. MMG025]MCF6443653.1 DsbA family protein [Nereida sp. MMG025]